MQRFRVGILTGGGDCPGLNAVIRAVTKSFILQCDAEVWGFEDGYRGLSNVVPGDSVTRTSVAF